MTATATANQAPSLTPEQQQAIMAVLAGGTLPLKVTEKTEKKSKSKKSESDLQNIHKQEQRGASERDQLVIDGNRLCGCGLTIDRINYANRVYSYCRANGAATKGGMLRVIGELQASILHAGGDLSSDTTGKTGKIRTVNESLRLALVAQFVPQVKVMDYGCAMLFVRFLDKFNPADPAMLELELCKTIALGVSLRDKCYLNKNGFIDRKLVKEAIDDVLGKREAPGKGESESEEDTESESGVTSLPAVIEWFKVASSSDLEKLALAIGNDLLTSTTGMWVKLIK